MLALGVAGRAGRAAQRRPPGAAHAATAPTRGAGPSSRSSAGGSSPRVLRLVGRAGTSCRSPTPPLDACARRSAARRCWPSLVALAGALCAAAAVRRRPSRRGRARRRRRWPHDRAARHPLRATTTRPVLDGVDLTIEEGELVLVSGPTGVGKSTLLGVVTGLVPRFTGGRLDGDVLLDGASVVRRPPRERAHVVGYVGQDPAAGFVTDTVEEELAYGMEQLGLPRRHDAPPGRGDPRPARHRRPARAATCARCRGGQQQRVAIGSVLTMHPRLLVLDEPTSALDPTAAEEVLATLTRLVHDLGVSVLLAEHRLERVVPFADRMCLLDRRRPGRRSATRPSCSPTSPVVPPIVELGRAAGWRPLPLSVRDARRRARGAAPTCRASRPPPASRRAAVALEARGVTVVHGRDGRRCATSTSRSARGRVTALMGRNGSGKSSLLWALQGSGRRRAGHGARSAALDPAAPRRRRPARRSSGWCRRPPPTCSTSRPSREECAAADGAGAAPALPRRCSTGWCRASPDDHAPARPVRGAAAGAGARAGARRASRRVLLLDEPTRGLDYPAKRVLRRRSLRDLAADGPRRAGRHPRRRVRRAGRRRGGGAGRGRGRLRRARYAGWSPSRRRSRRRSPRCSAPPWLRVDEVVAALGRRR